MIRYSATDRIGVNLVESFFLQNGWIPRTILQSDVGLDMEVEISEDGMPTGQLLGIQIKTGKSYFNEVSDGSIIFRGSTTHLEYWLNHSLPILIILHNEATNQTIWQKITEKTIIRTSKSFKVSIPINNTLNVAVLNKLKILNKYPIYIQRLQRLAIHKQLMLFIKKDKKIIIELQEWINKSIGRATITIKKIDDEGDEHLLSEGGYIFFKGLEDLEVLFPWADFYIDDDFYEESDENDYHATYGEHPPYSFREFRDHLPDVRAIDLNGEVHLYRFELSLNEIAQSFLVLHDFLEGGQQTKLKLG
jgi:hypothetical protein